MADMELWFRQAHTPVIKSATVGETGVVEFHKASASLIRKQDTITELSEARSCRGDKTAISTGR